MVVFSKVVGICAGDDSDRIHHFIMQRLGEGDREDRFEIAFGIDFVDDAEFIIVEVDFDGAAVLDAVDKNGASRVVRDDAELAATGEFLSPFDAEFIGDNRVSSVDDAR